MFMTKCVPANWLWKWRREFMLSMLFLKQRTSPRCELSSARKMIWVTKEKSLPAAVYLSWKMGDLGRVW
jgi:hypothetical protein